MSCKFLSRLLVLSVLATSALFTEPVEAQSNATSFFVTSQQAAVTLLGNATSGETRITISGGSISPQTVNVGYSGAYSFQNIPAGSYILRPSHPDYIFSPQSAVITINPAILTGNSYEPTVVFRGRHKYSTAGGYKANCAILYNVSGQQIRPKVAVPRICSMLVELMPVTSYEVEKQLGLQQVASCVIQPGEDSCTTVLVKPSIESFPRRIKVDVALTQEEIEAGCVSEIQSPITYISQSVANNVVTTTARSVQTFGCMAAPGSGTRNPVSIAAANADSSYSSAFPASAMLDEDLYTYWIGSYGKSEHVLSFTLNQSAILQDITLTWYGDFYKAPSTQVYVSNDGSSYQLIAQAESSSSVISLNDATGKYVRVVLSGVIPSGIPVISTAKITAFSQ